MMARRIVMAVILWSGVCLPSWAVDFEKGDVFAAIGSGQVNWYRKATGYSLEATLSTTRGGFTTGMAFDASGKLYVTNFSDASVSRFNKDGSLESSQFVTTDSGSSAESIVFDSTGNFYVGQADGTKDILKYDASGTFLGRFDVAIESRGSDWIDLSADQTTMYYTSEGSKVKVFDVATNTQLADFADLGSRPAFALRLLDDGGLLVANNSDIKRLDSLGAVVQTYDVAGHEGWFALNLDPDATTFWSGDYGTGNFHQFDIATGTLLTSISTGSGEHFGLTVFGEITQGQPVIPEATSLVTFAGLMLCVGAGHFWKARAKASTL